MGFLAPLGSGRHGVTEEYHRAHKPANPRRDGAAGFDCKILVDDAILVEAAVGLRPWVSASCYEKGVKLMLGDAAVNEEKDVIEGTFKDEQVIWGLVMNTSTNTVALPERRILKGAHLLTEPEFEAGCYSLRLRQLQQFRGIMTGWAVVVKGLRNELKAADIFLTNGDGAMPVKPRRLGYRDEDQAAAQAWEDLWSLFEACKWLAARSETWEMKFGAKLEELLPPMERLSRPGSLGESAVFVSADATRSIIGAIDWSNGFVARAKVEELQPWLQEVLLGESEDEEVLIHITEMLAIVALACRLGERWVGKVGVEESIVYDRCGVPGHVRQLSPLEVWWCQGRTTEEWHAALAKCGSEEKAKIEGCRATGAQTAQTLLMAAAALYRGGAEKSCEKAGAVRDYQDESLAKLLLWLRRWRKKDFGEDRGPDDRRAGGVTICNVSRYAEAMWLEAMEELENYAMMSWHAGGRKKRADANEERGNSLVRNEVGALLPFDGGVTLRVDEWLEANMHGDKAESTSRAYQSSWQKWVAWARRQAWDSEYLDPKQAKLDNENKLLAFLGYMGWLGASPATMRQTLASIKDYHKRAGAGDPTEGMYRIWLLVNSLDRRTSKKPRRLGVTPGMLKWIGGQLSGGVQLRGEKRVDSVMLQAALLTAWYFMMRASEYCDSGGRSEKRYGT